MLVGLLVAIPMTWTASSAVAAGRAVKPSSACATASAAAAVDLYSPSARRSNFEGDLAKYLVALHDADGTFDFCGGMMFQIVLSEKLREHLLDVATGAEQQPYAFDAATDRMAKMPGYRRDATADNVQLFHGREVRNVDWAAGGMGFAIHLSLSADDAEGWTPEEVSGYDGWGHDAGRVWRNGEMLEREGFADFRRKFGERAYTLHHRFYLHLGHDDNLWLSAEDGCEGQVAKSPASRARRWPF